MRHPGPALILLALALTLPAQGPTFVVTPDTAAMGTTRNIRVTATNTISVDFPGCLFSSVHSAGPGGPVLLGTPCPTPVPTQVQMCGVIDATWTPPASLGTGTFWLRCDYTDLTTGVLLTRWADFRIEQPQDAVLNQTVQSELGAVWSLDLLAAPLAGAPYIAAASLTTDVAQGSPAGLVSLDADFLFALSFPTPLPSLFTNFQGTLDATGQATLLANIPNLLAYECVGVHVQAIILPAQGPPVLSNCVDSVLLST